jgi:hypothetical protein
VFGFHKSERLIVAQRNSRKKVNEPVHFRLTGICLFSKDSTKRKRVISVFETKRLTFMAVSNIFSLNPQCDTGIMHK